VNWKYDPVRRLNGLTELSPSKGPAGQFFGS